MKKYCIIKRNTVTGIESIVSRHDTKAQAMLALVQVEPYFEARMEKR